MNKILEYPHSSSIEEKIKEALNELGIDFIPQYKIDSYKVDFYLPFFHCVLEVYGCAWHACKACAIDFPLIDDAVKVRERDELREYYLRYHGYEVLVMWEHDVRKKDFVERLLDILESSEYSDNTILSNLL
jgi:G:T-mismatch repair DNA endonuclease (very short patch repair protein)